MIKKNLDILKAKQKLSEIKSSITSDKLVRAEEFLADYEINLLQVIGGGSFGLVIKGYDENNQRNIAIKLLICQDMSNMKSWLNEYQKMKMIKNKNVINTFDMLYDEKNETILIISEFCPNGDLKSFKQRKGTLSVQEISTIIIHILDGLKGIHSKNIIHSDLKPENIVFDANDTPKICDLGLSKKLEDQKNSTVAQGGSFLYAPLEQIDGKVCKESDMFAVGSIVCFLCELNLEGNFNLNCKLKNGQFPDIEQNPFKDLLTIAFNMMKVDVKERLTIEKSQEQFTSLLNTKNNDQSFQNSNNEEEPIKTFKICLIGDAEVGKTFLHKRYTRNGQPKQYNPTIGVEFGTKEITLPNGKKVKFQIWDTAGQQRYREVLSLHFRLSLGGMIVYDITKKQSFQSVEKWIEDFKMFAHPNVVMILIGAKSDLEQERQVSKQEGIEFAQKNNLLFQEVSTFSYESTQKVFDLLLEELLKVHNI